MKKKSLSILLTLALLCPLLSAPALAAPAAKETDVIMTVGVLGILNGDEQGNLNLNQPVTRAEFSKMAIAASVYKDSAAAAAVSPYPDVPYTHWAAGYIKTAVDAGWLYGYLDGTFRPGNHITLEEGVTILLRMLGYTNAELPGAYPTAQLSKASSLGLLTQVTAAQGQTLTRRDAMRLFYNTLLAKTAANAVYLTTLGHSVTAGGEVDLAALINESLEGPVVATAYWQSALPFPAASASYYRDGKLAASADIREYDVLYWVEHVKTVYAYGSRVSGTIQTISPNTSAPDSVTVAGKSYALETAAASFALSVSGSFKVGDVVTLLLGKDGGVAGVVSAISSTLYGVVSSTGTDSYTENGGSVSRNTATIIATDGNLYTYPVDYSGYKPGDFVQVTSNASGITMTGLSTKSITGKVNPDGTQLGNDRFAANVEILDVSVQGSAPCAVRLFPGRLAGMTIPSARVRFFLKNTSGEITHLILRGVTGDTDLYGLILKAEETNESMTASGSYSYDIAGTTGSFSSSSKTYNVVAGPAGFSPNVPGSLGSGFSRVYNLPSVRLTALTADTAHTADGAFPLSETVVVYERKNFAYYLTDLSRVQNTDDFRLTGWYDTPAESGGRIRVIVAEART